MHLLANARAAGLADEAGAQHGWALLALGISRGAGEQLPALLARREVAHGNSQERAVYL